MTGEGAWRPTRWQNHSEAGRRRTTAEVRMWGLTRQRTVRGGNGFPSRLCRSCRAAVRVWRSRCRRKYASVNACAGCPSCIVVA